MTKEISQEIVDAQKAVIDALQETISAQERTILAKTRAVQALQDLVVLEHRGPLVWFTQEMEKKIRSNEHKDAWDCLPLDWLFKRLLEEVEELRVEIVARKSAHTISEAADVAIYAMMIADRVRE